MRQAANWTLIRVMGAILALGAVGAAQDVRGLGMGGALVPGPSLAAFNPAYSVYPPDGRGGGLTLPLGLLNFFVNPQLNVFDFILNPARYANPGDPTSPEFNALGAFDQATHLNTFILNPVTAPQQISINISATGITLSDQNGTPLAYDFSSGVAVNASSGASSVGAAPLFRIPFGFGGLSIGAGLFVNFTGPSLAVNPELQNDVIARGGSLTPGRNYENVVTGAVQGSVGISLDAAYATSLEVPGATVYVGGRGAGFYGIALVDATTNISVTADSTGEIGKAETTYEVTIFRADPTNGGFGFGVNLDLGVAADLPSATLGVPELEKLTVGLGVVGAVDTYSWSGQEQTITASGTSAPIAATRGGFGFNPLVTLNAAGTFSLSGGWRVLALADLQFGRGVFKAHLGAEAQFGMVLLRSGLGFDNGFRFGLGAGLEVAPGLGFDLALTTHQAPFYNHTSFGVALAARFGF
jgi:hypothetical protein